MSEQPAPEFELPNAGAGPDPCSLSELATEHDFVVLTFQRDYHCANCREQVNKVADHVTSFRARDAVPVSILPEPRERAEQWQEWYDLPYPLLADPESEVADAYGQTVRFDFLAEYSDFLGRMPLIVVVDARDDPRIAWTYSGRSTFDRPSTREVLEAIDDYLAES